MPLPMRPSALPSGSQRKASPVPAPASTGAVARQRPSSIACTDRYSSPPA
ncbi:hypothetical protein [Janthinobacterium lividum]|nr:hypothetical protein [Janthinobacterium lividum]